MRVIKFRGQRIDTKQWVYGYLFENIKPRYKFSYIIESSFVPVLTMPASNFIEVIPETVGQFTGLTDKNGKEIYDGDLLRLPAKSDYEKHTFNSFEVFWHDNDSAMYHIGWQMCRMHTHGNSAGGHYPYCMLPKYTKKLEIIGSIHD